MPPKSVRILGATLLQTLFASLAVLLLILVLMMCVLVGRVTEAHTLGVSSCLVSVTWKLIIYRLGALHTWHKYIVMPVLRSPGHSPLTPETQIYSRSSSLTVDACTLFE